MSKQDVIETEGVVVEVLRNANFKVKLTNGYVITAYLSGKLHLNNIRILVGDSVKVGLGNRLSAATGKQTGRAYQHQEHSCNNLLGHCRFTFLS